jgi:hypothetical protein
MDSNSEVFLLLRRMAEIAKENNALAIRVSKLEWRLEEFDRESAA